MKPATPAARPRNEMHPADHPTDFVVWDTKWVSAGKKTAMNLPCTNHG